jgi:transposase
MSQTKRSRKSRGLFPVHPAAAAIDVGAALHVAAVGPDRDKEPVRTFRTFTGWPTGSPSAASGRS